MIVIEPVLRGEGSGTGWKPVSREEPFVGTPSLPSPGVPVEGMLASRSQFPLTPNPLPKGPKGEGIRAEVGVVSAAVGDEAVDHSFDGLFEDAGFVGVAF